MTYARAKEQSDRLIQAGVPPTDPAFDAVLKDLGSVPSESRFYVPAEQLRERLTRARTLVPRPLAEGTPSEDAALAKKQAECVALAQAMGLADAGQRVEISRKLDECRAAIDRYREQQHHRMEP